MATIKGNSTIKFTNNSAMLGGAVFINNQCSLLMVDNSRATFTSNTAEIGGAICLYNKSNIIFDNNTIVAFTYNSAANNNGAVHSEGYSNILVKVILLSF